MNENGNNQDRVKEQKVACGKEISDERALYKSISRIDPHLQD